MEKRKSLNLIFKVVRVGEGLNESIGTAFLVDKNYAITACHVLKKCLGYEWFLESYDGNIIICDLDNYCSIYNTEQFIDISVIKINEDLSTPDKYIDICNGNINTGVEYYSYGYPELNDGEELFLSGKVLSPEGTLSIDDSAGNSDAISLYDGVSGSPLIINDIIYGLISNEIPSTIVTKPKLIAVYIYNIVSYLENKLNLSEDELTLKKFMEKYCKSNGIIDRCIDPLYKEYDNEFKLINNKKNLDEKIKSVCPDFPEQILKVWRRKCVRARLELDTINSKQRKALIMAVYSPCIDYIDEYINDIDKMDEDGIRGYIDILKKEAIKFIEERKKDYNYGIENIIVVENLVFELIDSCFLSFESY